MVLEQIINGIMLGMIYALIAVGYSLVFGILRLLNMAHGSIYMFGAHMALFAVSMHWGLPAAFVFAIITTGILAMAMDGETSIQGGELNVMAKVELVYSYKVLDQAMEPIG